MTPITIAAIVFGALSLASLLGFVVRRWLPEQHVEDGTKDVVRLVMGLIATMAALVLGLLIASAKSSYDTQRGALVQLSTEIVQLDRLLAVYGPETLTARARFHAVVERAVDRIWPSDRPPSAALPGNANIAADLYTSISNLEAQTDGQRFAKAHALEIAADLSRTRVLMYAESGSSIPFPFLLVLVFWLVILFVSFGMFAPANPTVMAVLLVGALSVSGAIFLILELDTPFEGVMHLSSTPLRGALAQIGP
jgi:hypothetical protein